LSQAQDVIFKLTLAGNAHKLQLEEKLQEQLKAASAPPLPADGSFVLNPETAAVSRPLEIPKKAAPGTPGVGGTGGAGTGGTGGPGSAGSGSGDHTVALVVLASIAAVVVLSLTVVGMRRRSRLLARNAFFSVQQDDDDVEVTMRANAVDGSADFGFDQAGFGGGSSSDNSFAAENPQHRSDNAI